MSLHRLLLVEDDADMAAMLAAYLQRHGLHVTRADSRATALAALRGGRVDLILLDVSLGDDDGVAICAEIREAQDVPIIMVSALSADHQRMAGYEVGADDYIAKPFNPDLLLARIRAVLRRAGRAPSLSHRKRDSVLRFAGWRYDARRDEVTAPGGWQVSLSSRETALLRVFLANPLIPLTRDEIAAALDDDEAAEGRAIDMLVGRLRQKTDPALIRTERGLGYVLSAEVARDAD
ncbi:regulator [Paracoccus sp. S4493]|jgi:two-component system OmpR family response regulator|uniref:Response regulator transcription factor n=1 Tax=Paracoccus marcusii TaxID=59779 RepID=A0ABY7UU89_9RHOB|nr:MULTISPECIES: response regulator transcription factor [Paracoccus]TYP68554.1 two-component system OmpR family response regulator [Stutzerimonas stutzeri]AZY92558.1 response regulator transcription factor [Paracoccus sp. Arc7-R13]KIX17443.1 regulator [Paracoccus sp. 228]KJZ31898.1 regulator [Paracoccus sp. S4493]MCO6361415.1 response regulator [Paracoccus sp. 08]|tara:strand:- start:11 stop:715 length:705 start_codon:yes stop_codon:yes gene_type:complete